MALLFLSHRWDDPAHPDPTGQQLRTIQALLKRTCVVVRALFANRAERLMLAPNLDRVRDDLPVVVPEPPTTAEPMALTVLPDGYRSDRDAFLDAVTRWKTTDGSLEHAPPDAWSAYRSLQGSDSFSLADDPNPARRTVEVVRSLSTELLRRWWLSDRPVKLDVIALITQMMDRQGLRSTDPSDRVYLGLLLSSSGWIEPLRPFFRWCVGSFLQDTESLEVDLQPVASELRTVLASVRPSSSEVWFSRLSSQTGHRADERAAIDRLLQVLSQKPRKWRRVDDIVS